MKWFKAQIVLIWVGVVCLLSQLVHGPSTKTRVAYILSLLREPQPHSNDSTLMEEDEDSDGEEGDITMFDSDVCPPPPVKKRSTGLHVETCSSTCVHD